MTSSKWVPTTCDKVYYLQESATYIYSLCSLHLVASSVFDITV